MSAFSREPRCVRAVVGDHGDGAQGHRRRGCGLHEAILRGPGGRRAGISTAKSLTELVEKQTSFAQHALEGWAEQAIRISAIYTSAAKDIAAPLGERLSSATGEMRRAAR